MSRADDLLEYVGPFKTSVGAAFPGSRAVFRGHDLHEELAGELDWFGLCALGVTGRRMPEEHLEVIRFMWVSTSYPDARIWNNRVAALAGTTRSTPNLGLTAGHALSEAMIYGRRNEFRALTFFTRTKQAMDLGATLAECIERHLAEQGTLAGYGRPLAEQDERIAPMLELLERLGLGGGPHLTLAYEVERELAAQGRKLAMNYGAMVSAIAADFGLSGREFTMLVFPVFVGGMQPVYLEALEKPPGAIFPTPVSEIAYAGPGPREWPSRN